VYDVYSVKGVTQRVEKQWEGGEDFLAFGEGRVGTVDPACDGTVGSRLIAGLDVAFISGR
jgi:hypothetical protein